MPIQNLSDLKKKICELLSLLKDVIAYIRQIDNSEKEMEVREQVKGISKIISDLELKRIPIPNELRNLKSSLINQLTELEELNKAVSVFYIDIKAILGLKPQPKPLPSPQPKPNTASIHLKDLVDDGIILPNTKIMGRKNKISFQGTITQNGQILVNINGVNKYFDSPSGAAKAILGHDINGWDWWSVIKEDKKISLSVFREKY